MKAKQILVYAAIFLVFAVSFVACDAETDDKVDLSTIPLWPEDAKGLNVYSNALGMPGEGKDIHYVYVKCTNTTGDHPLILWLNGGPGMSSMLGFAKEIGPAVIEDGEDEFTFNAYHWARFANLLFLDAPAGVGFSKPDPALKPSFTDNKTAIDNYEALIMFFSKFPKASQVPFYIAGEQYGGVHAPWLAKTILDRNPHDLTKINFKGLIIANGIVNPNPSFIDDHYWEFLYGHQILNLDTWETFNQACTIDKNAPRCVFAKKKIENSTQNLNMQDVLRECYYLEPEDPPQTKKGRKTTRRPVHRRSRYNSANDLEPSTEGNFTCIDSTRLEKVLNTKEFKLAFHAPTMIGPLPFKFYLYNTTIIDKYQMTPDGSYSIMQELFNRQPEKEESKFKFLIYHGDTDAEVPLNSVEAWLAGLGLEQHPEARWEPWYHDQQADGFVTKYKNKITFATVRGVGQSAAQWKRREVAYLVERWLTDLPLPEPYDPTSA